MASKSASKVIYQFKVELLGVSPTIWRRIQVPSVYSFWELHVAIQDAMGWWDYHLHEFSPGLRKPYTYTPDILRIGEPDDQFGDSVTQAGWDILLADHFDKPGDTFMYLYDFGDSWHHSIILEGILLAEPKTRYPKCTAGANACPPEDCGGIPGYENLLELLENPQDEEYASMMEWLKGATEDGTPFNPAIFRVVAHFPTQPIILLFVGSAQPHHKAANFGFGQTTD